MSVASGLHGPRGGAWVGTTRVGPSGSPYYSVTLIIHTFVPVSGPSANPSESTNERLYEPERSYEHCLGIWLLRTDCVVVAQPQDRPFKALIQHRDRFRRTGARSSADATATDDETGSRLLLEGTGRYEAVWMREWSPLPMRLRNSR